MGLGPANSQRRPPVYGRLWSHITKEWKEPLPLGYVTLAAITRTFVLVPYLLYIYISFIRSHVTYNSGTIWEKWQTNTKSAGKKKQIKWKKSKNQYKNLEAISRQCHVHKKYIKIFKSSHWNSFEDQAPIHLKVGNHLNFICDLQMSCRDFTKCWFTMVM